MSKMFLDPNRPLHTCSAENCNGCEAPNQLTCHFNGKQLLRFALIGFPPFIIAGIIIARLNPWLLIPWVLFTLTYFGLVEIRVMCSHCPHYGEPGLKTLKCWANYGAPKLWKFRPGPMSLYEKIVFYSGFVIIFGYPIVCSIFAKSYLLLGLYLIIAILFGWALKKYYCGRCINFACPLNHVDHEIRNQFFNKNPTVRDAWN
jgi:hypothetical protein